MPQPESTDRDLWVGWNEYNQLVERLVLGVLVGGLVLSVALMGIGSTLVMRVMNRFPSVIWVGLGVITYVAIRMIWDGAFEVQRVAVPYLQRG